ncbi:MAG: DUF3737 family protein [Lachnospiraceae bacterium]|nr:DUF3737 family protein [Lachnospiraceae bacterium]
MTEIKQQLLTGERALFGSEDVRISDCVFDRGESPLKESRNIELNSSLFRWKYPLWYCNNVRADGCTWFDMARAGVWYTENINVTNAVIQAPKNFRRSKNIRLVDVAFTDAKETLWTCQNIVLKNVSVANGDYFAMNCEDMSVDGLTLDGNYSFDGVKRAVIRNSRLLTKDAFWNSENITVYDSFISGEYLGWNSKNLTLVNCTIESLQGMCYIDNLVMKNCKLINTTLAFEYSSVDAEITSKLESVFNPGSGTIRAESIGELIIEKDKIDPSKTRIICNDIAKESDRPEWLRKKEANRADGN